MAAPPLRILCLSTRYPNPARPQYGNFVERRNVALATRAGVEIVVVAPVGLPPFPFSLRHPALRRVPLEELRTGLRVHHPRYPYLPFAAALAPAAIARAVLPLLRDIRRTFPFDLIHAESFWPEAPAARILAQEAGVPFSVRALGRDIHLFGERPALRRQMVEAGSAAAAMLAVSESLRDAMAAIGLPRERIAMTGTGVDRDLFSPGPGENVKATLGIHGPMLLGVGNLLPDKGQRLAVATLALLDDCTLVLAGSGPDAGTIRRQARLLGVEGRLRMLGSVPHALLPSFYRAADAMLHLPAREGFSNVRLEALACGTPLVTTAVGDAARLLAGHSHAGRVVPAEASAAAAAVREILDSPPLAATVREASDVFSWETSSVELERQLRMAASERRVRSG